MASLAWPGLLAPLIVVLLVLLVAGIAWLLAHRPTDPAAAVQEALARQAAAHDSALRALREEAAAQARQDRAELSATVAQLGAVLSTQMGTLASVQNNQIDGFAQQLVRLTESNEQRLAALREHLLADARRSRDELAGAFQAFSLSLQNALAQLSAGNDARLTEVRATLENRLRDLQADNGVRLEEMRRTVDEKLHATLEQRLGESFRHVSERLEQVHRGLGEMQALASDVGDLKRVLTNVKTRGVFGEVQLGALLQDLLVAEQYQANVEVRPGSGERVEFAIRLPGRGHDRPVWLPIDAKFPREDYERLLVAQEQADAPAADAAGRALEARLKVEARTIRDKYLCPPDTTDFALMFLPTEGLYAEALRRAGLAEELQRTFRVVLAGPTTLTAILSSLQMGFRTLAVEQRSSEVWQLLGSVKAEFGKFGDVLAKAKDQIDRASSTLGQYQVRTRAIERRLRDVESLPDAPDPTVAPLSGPPRGLVFEGFTLRDFDIA